MKSRLQFIIACLGFVAAFTALPAAEDAPKEGALNTYLNREPNDTSGQLALMQQYVFKLASDQTVIMFQLQYGNRVHMERIYYPANTSDHEFVPGYVFTATNAPAGQKRPGLVIVHGGFHESLDWRFFRLIVEAV